MQIGDITKTGGVYRALRAWDAICKLQSAGILKMGDSEEALHRAPPMQPEADVNRLRNRQAASEWPGQAERGYVRQICWRMAVSLAKRRRLLRKGPIWIIALISYEDMGGIQHSVPLCAIYITGGYSAANDPRAFTAAKATECDLAGK